MIPRFRSELDRFLQFMAQVDREYIAGSSIDEICRKYELSPEQFNTLLDRFATHPRATEALAQCQLFSAVVPIFWSRHVSERVHQIASGVLLRLPYATYLLTAAHVTDHWHEGHLFVPGEREIIALNGYFSYWKPSEGDSRELDNIDIAYVRLSRSTRAHLHPSFRDITLDHISYKRSVVSIPFATFAGYPVTKARRWNGVLSSQYVTYTGHLWTKDVYERLGYSQERHICVRMRTKDTYHSRHGRKLMAPHPRGVSGGAIFSWPERLKDRGEGAAMRLVGIAHSFDRSAHCLAGTHIQMYLNAIVHNNPKLRGCIQRAIDKAGRCPLA